MSAEQIPIRRAGPGDAADIARLLHDFNTEYSDPSPGVAALTEIGRRLLGQGDGATDTAARALYESCGFTNREGEPDGPAMLFYEREL